MERPVSIYESPIINPLHIALCAFPFFALSASAAEPSGKQAGVLVIPERKVPVLAEADVVVCGGGTAGVSAACCAARHGAKVILLERWPSLGGMATKVGPFV